MDIESKAVETGTSLGITWAITNGWPLGYNGYVKLPENHPWKKLLEDPQKTAYDEISNFVKVNNLGENLVGGSRYLTYNNKEWIGFDTSHPKDFWEGTVEDSTLEIFRFLNSLSESFMYPGDEVYWTRDAVVEMVQNWVRIVVTVGEIAEMNPSSIEIENS